MAKVDRQRLNSLRTLRNMRASGNRMRNTSGSLISRAVEMTRAGGFTFEDNREFAQQYNREKDNQATHGDRTAFAAMARAHAQNQRTNNYDYTQPGNYDRNARYRNLRAAFSMSAG